MTSLSRLIAASGLPDIVTGAAGRTLTRTGLCTQSLAAGAGLSPDMRVALFIDDPVDFIRALVALDGQVAGMLLLSHALDRQTVADLARAAHCTIMVSDRSAAAALPPNSKLKHVTLSQILSDDSAIDATETVVAAQKITTQWLLTTSGTTGLPKIVPHSIKSLSRSVYRFGPSKSPVWGLFYDPTRFAGLQVVLQALIGGGGLIAVNTGAPLREQIALLASKGCTHLSATPTLWRRILMVPQHDRMLLRQITLGGEIADAATLARLRASFPKARLTHIYASTEAGVGFSVTDEQAGFPTSYLEAAPGNVALRITDDILWLRPPGATLPAGLPGVEVDADGYICSGDRVTIENGRALFQGRESGMINIGGVKVYPETVETVIKTVPGVAMVQISAKKSPVTGALVVADVQLEDGAEAAATRKLIQQTCKAALPREAAPAMIRFVENFEINAAGKLVRKKG